MDKKKKDCKYWDKCYQRNAEHHDKYNHPEKTAGEASTSTKHEKTPDPGSPKMTGGEKSPKKRSPRNPSMDANDPKRVKRSPTKSPSSKTEDINHLQVPDSSTKSRSPSPNKGKSPSKASPARRSPRDVQNPPKESLARRSPREAQDPSSTASEKNNQQSKTPSPSGTAEKPKRKEIDTTDVFNQVMTNLAGMPPPEPEAVRYSQKAEYDELLQTPAAFIRHMFLVEMPPDFYKFWKFCEEQAKPGQKPETVLEKFGLKLVGPFDCLAKNFHDVQLNEPGAYLRHWRFYYDPPEFQTVFVKDKSELHYGYWRDDPKEKDKLLMARNDSSKGCEFGFAGGNCFETVLFYLDNDAGITPFNRQPANALRKSLELFAQNNDINLKAMDDMKKKRDRKVVCKTFHKAGLVVPFDRKTELGYRGLVESDVKLKKILTKMENAKGDKSVISAAMEELQIFITAANIAVDECDFGTAIELGIDLFSSGLKELHAVINTLLVTGYSMVDRPQFIAIMKTHMEQREKGANLSIFC